MNCEHEFQIRVRYSNWCTHRGICQKCGVWGWKGVGGYKTWRPYKENSTEPRPEWQRSNPTPTARPSHSISGASAIIMSDKNYNG